MKDKDILRGQIESAVAGAFAKDGDAMSSASIVKQFSGQGASQATLFRWVRAAIESGMGAPPTATSPAATCIADSAPAGVTVSSQGRKPPAQMSVSHAMPPILDQLQQCIAAAQKVMVYATTEDGAVRNSKLLLGASENLRRAIETSVKLHDAVMDVVSVERFHQAVFDVLNAQSPEIAEAVVVRLRELNAQWMERMGA